MTIQGTLTTALGALESGRSGFVQDGTGGIAIYLDAASGDPFPAGAVVRLTGTIDERYAARTLRTPVADVMVLDLGGLPAARAAGTGEIGELLEGWRVTVDGVTVGSPTSYADGLGILVDDGSGSVRVIVGPAALQGASLPAGTHVRATGPVGQRDSSGTGGSGYRIHATLVGELEVVPAPSPSSVPSMPPTPAPSIAPTPSPGPSIGPSPSPSPSPAPTATAPTGVAIAEARRQGIGTSVTVAGVVVAEAGRLGTPPLIAIADDTGGIVVRVPDGVTSPGRGSRIVVTGPLADPYGQLEIRPSAGGFVRLGTAVPPAPASIEGRDLGEATEGRLVTIDVTITATPRKATSGDLTIDAQDDAATPLRLMVDASAGIAAGDLARGRSLTVVGIVGQRASKKGALDGYRIWLRDRGDITPIEDPSPTAGPGASPGPGTSASPSGAAPRPIREVIGLDGEKVVVEGVVIAGAGLLDADGRRLVIQDDTAAIEVLLPTGVPAPDLGSRVRVEGTAGRAWDAPRIKATAVAVTGNGTITPRPVGGAPSEAVEWQLVRLAGTVTDVTRLGARWRADLKVGGQTVLVTGLEGAGIPSTALVEGRSATVVGIVRRPYPTSTDRRWAVVPRGSWDVVLGPAVSGGPAGDASSGRGGSSGRRAATGAVSAPTVAPALLIDLAELGTHAGERIRVSGLVDSRAPGAIVLDDGTGLATVRLEGEAAAFLDLIEAGDAIGLIARVQVEADGPVLVATEPGGIVRLGDLGEAIPLVATVAPSLIASPPPARAALTDDIPSFGSGLAGLLALAGLSLASLGATLVRRRRMERRLARAVVERLAGRRAEP